MKKHYEYDSNTVKAKGLEDPSILHRCPYCSGYLWGDKNHQSYNHCTQCGRSLKGKKLPYEII